MEYLLIIEALSFSQNPEILSWKLNFVFKATQIQPIDNNIKINNNVFYSSENLILANSCYALNCRSKEFFDPTFYVETGTTVQLLILEIDTLNSTSLYTINTAEILNYQV